ncbi:hypothetical protein SE17_15450 [Kouleothrix aurantiaca]|uniref:Uncharacterized protein n=1 Tax=Kouleothrix aurantiaca TaxID=186479 RepID=A0A0P9FH46_9CHLR|nr:hypothetical protein SE17_15450 [Kouleothrix aurantiaca]
MNDDESKALKDFLDEYDKNRQEVNRFILALLQKYSLLQTEVYIILATLVFAALFAALILIFGLP